MHSRAGAALTALGLLTAACGTAAEAGLSTAPAPAASAAAGTAGTPATGARPSSSAPAAGTPAAQGHGTVAVLYAGSLVKLMEEYLGPTFQATTGYRFEGFAGGSQALANEVKGGLQRGDVFISASTSADTSLTGPANGNWVSWSVTFGKSPLVIGYNASSRFAAALQTQPWYQVLAESGFRLGRTDPVLDPKGQLTIQFVEAAQTYYNDPLLLQQVLGSAANPAQVFPEQDLVGRLQAGQLDAGFFYANEATDAGIPTLTLPAAIDPSATFTVTILRGAPEAAGATAFVQFLLGQLGTDILRRDGVTVEAPQVSGEASAVPPQVRAILAG